MAQTRRSTARGLEQVPSRRLSAVPAEEAASEAARRGKRRGRIKYRIFTLGLGLDMTMLFLILVLLAVGLVMMFSASYAYAYYYYGNSYYFILRQGMFALVGVVLMLAISTFDYHQLHKLNLPVFAVSILLLLMVLVFKGTKLAPNKGGAVRWLNLGFVEFQPSEIAKFALILMFAHLIALYGERMKTFRYGFLPFFGILGLICVLVIAEKHVSATIIICLIAFIMMFVGGTKFRYFAVIGGAAVVFALLAAVLFGVLVFLARPISSLMQAPAEALDLTTSYVRICGAGIFFIVAYNMLSALFRGLGDSRSPLIFVLVACVINIVGDLLLVGVFGRGAAGAAVATVAAQGVSLLLALAVLRHRDFPFDFKLPSFRPQGEKASKLLRLGLPVAVQNVLVTLSFLIITAIVNHMDVLAQSAAVGVVERVTGFIMLFPSAFMSAISAMTAQNMGAGRPDRARQALKVGILLCLVADLVMFALIQAFPGQALRLFTPDAEVIRHGVLYLRTYSIDCILVTFVFTLNGFYAGCGRTGFTLFNDLTATFLVRVPVVFFMSRIAGVTLLQIGIAAPAASAVQVLLQLLYLRTGRWNRSVLGEGRP